MYSRVEEQRLNYLRNGRRLQMSSTIPGEANTDSADIPVPENNFHQNLETMLPASFLGSRAWSSNQVADSLALARQYGKPTFFITMTTNPYWPEITARLLAGQSAADNPVIVCRVFHKKVQKLVEYLRANFGTILYMVRVIEFQKRGLPHMHMIIKVCIFCGSYILMFN